MKKRAASSGFQKSSKKRKANREVDEAVTDDERVDLVLPKNATLEHATEAAKASWKRDAVSAFFGECDYTYLPIKPDHASRPLWISPEDGHIFLEGFSPIAEQAQDFLIAISEPVSRPTFIHEYKITPFSLYAAVSVGLETQDIIDVLNRLSKVPIPQNVTQFIRQCTQSYGKVKLVLKHNHYFVESANPDILQMLLRDPMIGPHRVVPNAGTEEATEPSGLLMDKAPNAKGLQIAGISKKPAVAEGGISDGASAAAAQEKRQQEDEELFHVVPLDEAIKDVDDDEDAAGQVHSFEIAASAVEAVKKRCNCLDYPMLEEYDFRNDSVNPNLDIDLKPITTIRPYQEKSLSKMFGNGRARSGIIVLPCGAGKTLVGITAACTIKKSCLVLCTSGVSVAQWKQQFLQWSTAKESQIAVFTSDQKTRFRGDAGIVISTYSMVANTRNRSHDAQKMMNFLTSREWGFLLLDEVHVVPANMFRKVISLVATHAKLGLTATLLREDEKIDDLNFLIGPKLYEANWMDLAARGHIANVQCAEVWCPMTPEFYREYISERSMKRMLLYVMNPKKFQACQYLIRYHEERGDKVIVFSDNVYALIAYARKLQKPYIYGATGQQERMRILQQFQHNPMVNTIFLSKVGDTSIDLPEATCLIQISSHYGSRRQEAQRLGRILRAKRRNDEGFNAFFYSLVSKDTMEMYFSTKRQQFLIDQGYAFKVITSLVGIEDAPDLVYSTEREQLELLQSVLEASEKDADLNDVFMDETAVVPARSRQANSASAVPPAMRTTGSMQSLSGADTMAYVEYNRPIGSEQLRAQNPLLKKNRGNR